MLGFGYVTYQTRVTIGFLYKRDGRSVVKADRIATLSTTSHNKNYYLRSTVPQAIAVKDQVTGSLENLENLNK